MRKKTGEAKECKDDFDTKEKQVGEANLGLVGQEDVLAQAVGVVLLHPVRAGHVQPLAVAPELRPVLLLGTRRNG